MEIDGYAPAEELNACPDLVDRICAMLTKLSRSAEAESVAWSCAANRGPCLRDRVRDGDRG